MTAIGQRIRELRTERGLSQEDIERSTGMVRTYVSRVECGHTVPSVESIERFAGALGIQVHELFLQAPLNGGNTGSGKKEDSFVSLLSSYVWKMDSARRRVLMMLAERLAREDRK